jgi:hypothetical protein
MSASKLRMAVENCPELERLVQSLAKAMNEKGRIKQDKLAGSEERSHADEDVNMAIAAIRAHKADHQCEMAGPVDDEVSTTP